jgi:site-specific DNA-methyltransferase (adenine-specific)
MREMPDNAFDLAIVDPPYGIGKWSATATSKKLSPVSLEKISDWDSEVPNKKYWDQLKRVSKNQIVWGGNYFFEHLGNCYHSIIWNKYTRNMHLSDGEIAWTSFKKKAVRIYDKHLAGTESTGVTRFHPTQKPICLYEFLLDQYAEKGDRILDTHLGSGSIAIACHNLGFSLEGYELDEDYYRAACNRLAEHQKQLRLF